MWSMLTWAFTAGILSGVALRFVDYLIVYKGAMC